MKKLKVASIGEGWVALHRHLPVMDRSREFEVVGVIDRSPGVAAQVASRRGYRRFAETCVLEQVPWLDEVDAVTVSTAPMSHFDIVAQALRLGKHVLTEKPFAMSVSEGEQLFGMARERGLQLAVVHNFQFARSTKRLQEEIANGTIGAIRSINAIQFGNPRRRLPQWYEQLPLGLFYDESPHLLYLLGAIAGPIEVSRGLLFPSSTQLRTPARIDVAFRSKTMRGPISLHCNFESPISEWHVAVFGEHRLGIIDVFRDIYLSLPNDEAHTTSTVLRTTLCATRQHLWQHLTSGVPHLMGRLVYGNEEVFGRFYRAVNGDPDALAPISAGSALAVLRLQHAIIEQCENMQEAAARGEGS